VSDEPKVITDLRFLHEGKVEWLSTECATTGVNISEILAAYDTIRARLAAADQIVKAADVLIDVDGGVCSETLVRNLCDALNAYAPTTEDA